MPTLSSVHIPSAMNNLSIRSRGKKWKNLAMTDVDKYAKEKGLSFVDAYKQLVSDLYNKE